MKILYAIGNKLSGGIQLNRFLRAIGDKNNLVKIAAFKKTFQVPYRDWTLDALLDIFKPDHISTDNDNLGIYYEQLKYFNPDLIISDLEIFSSYLATLLKKPIIQVGPRIAYEGIENSSKLGIKSKYKKYLFKNDDQYQLLKNSIDNADARLAYSPLCDLKEPPKLKNGFEWIRPYHVLGKLSITAKHQIIGASHNNRRDLIQLLKKYDDAVLFTGRLDERFVGVTIKDIMQVSEYALNLYNAEKAVNHGQQDYIADAFYNGKYCLMMPEFSDSETIINSMVAEYYGLGQAIYDVNENVQQVKLEMPQYNPNIKYLHEKIEEF